MLGAFYELVEWLVELEIYCGDDFLEKRLDHFPSLD